MTKNDVQNILFTYGETARIYHDDETPITYNRLNHIPFKYEIYLRNKEKNRGKVFVRIFLGLLNEG